MTDDTRLAVLKDTLASALARTIEVQREVIDLLHQRIGALEQRVAEFALYPVVAP